MKVSVLKRLDRLGGRLSASLFPARKAAKMRTPKRIAVIRLWAIGESLLALPAIAALKQRWPEAEITVITTPNVAPVFSGQEFIDEIQVIEPRFRSWSGIWLLWRRRKTFDVAIDFEPYFYTSAWLARAVGKYSVGFDTLSRGRLYTKSVPYQDDQHVVKTNFDLVRALGVKTEVPERLIALQGLSRNPHPNPLPIQGEGKKWVALAPGGSVDFRRWPAEQFAEVADYLIEKHVLRVVLIGDEADAAILKDVQGRMKHDCLIVSNLSLPEVAKLLSTYQLTIANDGGLMHVSAAMGTTTLGLFGPETPVRLGPYGSKNRALYHQLEDNPIINVHRGEVPGILRVGGDLSRYVRAITVEEVIAAADEMLKSRGTISIKNRKVPIAIVALSAIRQGSPSPWEEMAELTFQNKASYSKQRGYESRMVRTAMDHGRPAAWDKIALLREMMPSFAVKHGAAPGWVWWSDADSLVMNFRYQLEGVIEEAAELAPTRSPVYAIFCCDHNVLNSGSFLIRACPESETLLRQVWEREQFTHHPWWENAALIDMLGVRGEKAGPGIVMVPMRQLQSYYVEGKVLGWDESWNNFTTGDFLIHTPAVERTTALAQLQRLAERL